MGSSKYVIRKIHPTETEEYTEEEFDLNITGDMTGAHSGHGGGDDNLTADFIKYLNGEEPSVSCTEINDSARGHLAVFKADESRIEEKITYMDEV